MAPNRENPSDYTDQQLADLDATLIGNSQVMKVLKQSILKAAKYSFTVLVTGESGTGKEVIARSIHELSSRRDKPFVAVNCSCIPEALIESEMFGHIKGAFTGAIADKKGHFEVANGGTIFLDEIGEMSPAMQVRLLRVLQERRVRPIGSTKEIAIDVRVIVATNRDLEQLISEGEFRDELYQRIDQLRIASPPLRTRIDDVPLLVKFLLSRLYENSQLEWLPEVDPVALKWLANHRWRGNVRGLENMLIKLAVNAGAEGIITSPDVLPCAKNNLADPRYDQKAELAEGREVIVRRLKSRTGDAGTEGQGGRKKLVWLYRVIDEAGGNKSEAARRLGVKRTALLMQIDRLEKRFGNLNGRNLVQRF